MTNAVVLVSGGAAVTPFTTPDSAAPVGLAAGNTMTALREHLLAAGRTVFTAPARIGPGQVVEDAGWQGFSGVSDPLPAELTVNAVGTIDDGGAALAGFLAFLRRTHGVTAVDLVAHSMGGLFSRSAVRQSSGAADAPTIARLVTLGTPWTGSLLGDFADGSIQLPDAQGDSATERILQQAAEFATQNSQGAAEQVGHRYLTGDDGWNAGQAGALAGVAVTVIAGHYFAAATEPDSLWPHDGLVARRSALAVEVPESALPHRTAAEFDDVHSIFFADAFGLPWTRALTWDPEVFAAVDDALAR